jgi:hypothetical protein
MVCAMSKTKLVGFLGATALSLILVASAAHADPLRYAYVPLDQIALPAPYTSFSPSSVVNGRVYGTVFDDTFTIAAVAVYDHGAITIGPSGIATVANARGSIGGSLTGQAALFEGNTTTLVPALPAQASASIVSLGDNKLALVQSNDSSFISTFAYFRAGTETVIDFGLPDPASNAFMNNAALIGLTKNESRTDHFLHGYRFDPRTGTSTLLPPSPDPTDVNVLIEGINAGGDVLGYSFTDFESPNYHERVGIWDKSGVFQTYFFETINTQILLFNDRDEIVITESSDGESYLVPSPGTRLDLASLTSNVPAGLTLTFVSSIDNAGNIVGSAIDQNFDFFPFLLTPLGHGDPNPGPCHVGNPLPASIARGSDKNHPHK